MAFWYGINPFELEPMQRLALKVNLPRVRAQDQIRRGSYDQYNPNDVYDLYLAAYGEAAADNAMHQSAKMRVDMDIQKNA